MCVVPVQLMLPMAIGSAPAAATFAMAHVAPNVDCPSDVHATLAALLVKGPQTVPCEPLPTRTSSSFLPPLVMVAWKAKTAHVTTGGMIVGPEVPHCT